MEPTSPLSSGPTPDEDEPETAYVCGTPDSRDPMLQTMLVLGISGDSGHTWQTHMTHLAASTCQITVDPIDAQDLLLAVERCFACSTPSPAQLYRSFDGGLSWRLVQFPALGTASLPPFTAFWWAWQGAAVFIWPVLSGPTNGNRLAVSVADSPFTWVNEQALLAQVPASMQLSAVYATTSAVYVEFTGSGIYAPIMVVRRGSSCPATRGSTYPHGSSETATGLAIHTP